MLLICVALYRELVYIIIVSALMVANILTSIIYRKKWCIISGFLSQATQLLLFAVALDCIYSGMYKVAKLFVWYEYLISIGIQIVAIIISIFLVVKLTNPHNKNKSPAVNIVAGSIAGLAYVSASILCKIFLTEASLSVVITIIGILINIMVYLLSYLIIMAMHRACLIKKYKLDIDMDEQDSK